MIVYLAGQLPWLSQGIYDEIIDRDKPYILESFPYATETTKKYINRYGKYILDSGAFTFVYGKEPGNIRWEEYAKGYADFISKNGVKRFFELDIDSIVGYEEVLRLRQILKTETGIDPIPVWHPSRGFNEFIKSCEEFDYVAIGGIVGGSAKEKKAYMDAFPYMIRVAHQNNAKIHGLGCTPMTQIDKYHFDSVDSSSWLSGARFGFAYRFNGRRIEHVNKGENEKIKDMKRLSVHNFEQWIKFQKYAEVRL